VHKHVRATDIPGRRIQPRKENDQSIRVGNEIISPNVINVSVTA
jgi:hypothetical protein